MPGSLGSIQLTPVYRTDDHTIDISLVGGAVLKNGTIVKLGGDGKVTKVAASTDRPFGIVMVGNTAIDEKVTVKTTIKAEILATVAVGETVNEGDLIAITDGACDATVPTYSKVAPATFEDWVYGIALTPGAAGATVKIGLIHGIYQIPAEVAP